MTTLGVRKDAVLALLPLPPGGEETRRVGRVPLPFNSRTTWECVAFLGGRMWDRYIDRYIDRYTDR